MKSVPFAAAFAFLAWLTSAAPLHAQVASAEESRLAAEL